MIIILFGIQILFLYYNKFWGVIDALNTSLRDTGSKGCV